MDIIKMLVELREERERVMPSIEVLERLAYDRGKRRGRPPSWMSAMGAVKRLESAPIDCGAAAIPATVARMTWPRALCG
jgi:hypothetical protein